MLKRLTCLFKGHTPYRPAAFQGGPMWFIDQVEPHRRLVTLDVCDRCGKLYAVVAEKDPPREGPKVSPGKVILPEKPASVKLERDGSQKVTMANGSTFRVWGEVAVVVPEKPKE